MDISQQHISIQELCDIVGVHNCKLSIPERLLYAHDASAYRVIPQAIVFPEHSQHIISILKWSHLHGIGLTFRAAGTSLSGQAVGDGVIVDCSRHWNDISVLDRGLKVKVQPGIIGSHVNRYLKQFSRKIGPDPASINACMIGGILANNASGMCCGVLNNSYHTIQSLECILSNGTVINTADVNADDYLRNAAPDIYSEIIEIHTLISLSIELQNIIRHKYKIKNTVGYCLNAFIDESRPSQILKRLMIGSEGTLGFISKAILNTIPDLPYKATTMLYFDTIEDACLAIKPLVGIGIEALEIMDRAALRSVEKQKGAPTILSSLPKDGTALLAEFHAESEIALQEKLNQFQKIQSSLSLIDEPNFSIDENERALYWKIRKGMFPSVGAARAKGTGIINEDIAVAVEHLPTLVRDLRLLFEQFDFQDAIIFGHAKDGNLHFVIAHRFDTEDDIQSFGAFMDALAKVVVGKYNGSLKAEHGTGRNVAPYVEYEWGAELYAIMKRLKNAFDPYSILNPGIIINDNQKAHTEYVKPFPEVDDAIDTCIECGYCESHCPTKNITLSPRQRIILNREIALQHQNISILKDLIEYAQFNSIESCANDGLCSLACPVGINTGKYINEQKHRQLIQNQSLLEEQQKESQSIARRDARLKRSLNAGRFAAMLIGDDNLSKVTQLTSRVLNTPRWIGNLPTYWKWKKESNGKTAVHQKSLLYIPSCTTRLFAQPNGRSASIPNLILLMAKKAQINLVIPDTIQDVCCGMAYHSKGNHEVSTSMMHSMETLSGKYDTVLMDALSCSYHMKDKSAINTIDICDYLSLILDRISLNKISGTIVIHPPCSLQFHDEVQKLKAIAERCADKVIIPQTSGCCGFAGDHGFYHPEITESACKNMKNDIDGIENVIGYFSANPTCEIGMTLGTQYQYQSIVYLVAQAAGLL